MTAHPDRCNYSDILDQYILSEHVEWREDIRDYVFGGDKAHLNDNERIQNRVKEIEERETRRNKSVSDLTSLFSEDGDSDIQRIYGDILSRISNSNYSIDEPSQEEITTEE
jgi:hypothetical protein